MKFEVITEIKSTQDGLYVNNELVPTEGVFFYPPSAFINATIRFEYSKETVIYRTTEKSIDNLEEDIRKVIKSKMQESTKGVTFAVEFKFKIEATKLSENGLIVLATITNCQSSY